MKFLIIGHSVEDHIVYENKKIVKPGGIFYTAAALNYFKENFDEIFLCTAVQKENLNLFYPLYKNLNQKYFEFVNEIPKVFLRIHENKEREEIYKNITENLRVDISSFSSFNGILINMITGYDLNLNQLKKIRENFKGLIYLDVHTLSRGLNKSESGIKRDFRVIPDFGKWAELVDIVQVNQSELLTLSYKKNPLEIIKEVLNCGIKYLIVTKQELGAKIFSLKDDEIISIFISSIKIKVKNKIGCGDVFGAVFFYTYFKNKDVLTTLQTANAAGGIAASYDEPNELQNLKKDVFSRYN